MVSRLSPVVLATSRAVIPCVSRMLVRMRAAVVEMVCVMVVVGWGVVVRLRVVRLCL